MDIPPDMAFQAYAELESEYNAAFDYETERWAATRADLDAEDRIQAENAAEEAAARQAQAGTEPAPDWTRPDYSGYSEAPPF